MDKTNIKNRLIKYAGLCLLAFFSYEILQIFIYLFLDIILGVGDNFLEKNFLLIDIANGIILIILYLPVIRKIYKSKENTTYDRTAVSAKIINSIIISFAVIGISTLWFWIAENYLTSLSFLQNSVTEFDKLSSSISTESLSLIFLNVVVVGPIVEEIIFRIILINFLEEIFITEYYPVLISALLFGVWHWVFVQGVYTFFMGIILGIIYIKTKSILYPVLIHCLNNFLSVVTGLVENQNLSMYINIFFVLMILPGLYIVYRISKNNSYKLESKYNSIE